MHLFFVLLNDVDRPERHVERLRQFGLPEPLFLRARSVAAALSSEVPVFAGLRSLALGADEDRLILLAVAPIASTEEAQRIVERIQLEMNADNPPTGRILALPMLTAG